MSTYNLSHQHSLFSNVNFFLETWLALGIFIQVVGAFIIDNGYGTWVYLGFYLPLILLFIFNWRNAFSVFRVEPRLYTLIFIFLFYIALSTLWSDQPNLTKELKYSLLCFLYVVGVAIISKKEGLIHRVLGSAVICISLFTTLFIFKIYVINELPLMSRLTDTGFEDWKSLGNASIFGTFLGAIFIIGIMLARQTHNSPKPKILIPASMFLLFGAIFTYSRTMWVALLFVLVCYLLINKQYKSLIYASIAMLVLTPGILIIFPEIVDKFIYRSGFSFRPQIWMMTISHIIDKPLFGHGSNSSFNYLVTQTVNSKEFSYIAIHPHNLYLSIFYFSGLVGVLLYLLMLAMTLLQMKKYLQDYLVFLALGLLLFSLAEQIFEVGDIVSRPNEYYVIMWLPIGILLGRISHAKSNP